MCVCVCMCVYVFECVCVDETGLSGLLRRLLEYGGEVDPTQHASVPARRCRFSGAFWRHVSPRSWEKSIHTLGGETLAVPPQLSNEHHSVPLFLSFILTSFSFFIPAFYPIYFLLFFSFTPFAPCLPLFFPHSRRWNSRRAASVV